MRGGVIQGVLPLFSHSTPHPHQKDEEDGERGSEMDGERLIIAAGKGGEVGLVGKGLLNENSGNLSWGGKAGTRSEDETPEKLLSTV